MYPGSATFRNSSSSAARASFSFSGRTSPEIVIGRSSELDMVLVEDMVSRKHAKIVTDEKTVTIEDLGSTNGTFVNGVRLDRPRKLVDGDLVRIGETELRFEQSA